MKQAPTLEHRTDHRAYSNMRICFLIHRLSRRPGGIQIFTLELAKLLRQSDPKSDISILAWRTHEDEKIEDKMEGTEILHFKLPWPSNMYKETIGILLRDLPLTLSAIMFYFIFILRPIGRILAAQPIHIWRECLIEAIRGLSGFILATHEVFHTFSHQGYDVIQAHELFLGMASLFTARVRRIKTKIIYAYLWVLTEPFFLELEAELVKHTGGAILFDDGTPQVKFRKWGIPREKVLETQAIINCKKLGDAFTQKDKIKRLKQRLGLTGEKVVLYVGRLSPEKGVDQVVLAFPKVLRKTSNAKLILCGPAAHDAYFRELLQCIEQEGMKDKVIITGGVAHSDVPLYYLMGDVIVSASPLNNLGMATKEAMLAGKPVVVSNSGGTGNIILDGETGLVFDHGNLEQFSDKIIQILESPDLSKRLGLAAKEYAQRSFCFEKIIPSLIAMYEKD